MSESMIERCAKAITPGWETASRNTKENARITVRTVLKEARDPSKVMIDKAWSLMRSNLRYEEVYRHMIGAALDE